MTFTKIVTFTQSKRLDTEDAWPYLEVDIYRDLHESISFVQGLYCHPSPSEYFSNIEFLISEDKTHCEIIIEHPSQEHYLEWESVYGEIMEELYQEMLEEYKAYNITSERFVDNVEIANMKDARPTSEFISKIKI